MGTATETLPKQEVITPASEAEWLNLRAHDITSTEVAALFGVSPYSTLFELWHRKRDKIVVSIEPNQRMTWGTRLESAIANGIAEDNGWKIRRMPEYIRNPALRMGASFDFAIEPACFCNHYVEDHGPDRCVGDGCTCTLYDENDQSGLLEIKNVDSLAYRDGWIIDGDDIEAPPHIEIQVQHQLAVSGRAFAYLGALVGGNKVILIKREPDPKIIDAIKSQVGSFWFTVAAGKEPVPDFHRDAKFIARLYNFADPNKVFDARTDANLTSLMAKYQSAGLAKKSAEEEQDAIKAQILMQVGDAEKVLGEGWTISAGVVGEADIAYHRNAYRSFKPYFKKSKGDK